MKRLRTEGSRAFEAFKTYVDMGAKRSHEATAKKLGKSKQLISRWAAQHNWKERLLEHEMEEARQRTDAQGAVALENARLREARKAQLEKESWEFSELLRNKAREILSFPTMKQTVHQDGKTITIHPGPFRLGDAARIAEVADALGRISVGLPSKITEVGIGGKGGGPLIAPKVRLKVLTNKESDAVLKEMRVDVG